MAEMITRCPKCATAFRISDSLLTSAKGVVRCGSCLNVFNAREHIIKNPSQPSPTATQTKKSQARPATAKAEQLGFEYASNNPEHSSEPNREVTRAPRNFPPQYHKASASNLFEQSPATSDAEDDQDETDSGEDESWALELLKDDTDANVQFKKIADVNNLAKHQEPSDTVNRFDELYDIPIEKVPESAATALFEDNLPPLEAEEENNAQSKHSQEDISREQTEPKAIGTEQAPSDSNLDPKPVKEAAQSLSEFVLDNTSKEPSAPTSKPKLANKAAKQPTPISETKAQANRQNALTKYNAHQAEQSGKTNLKEVIASIEPEPLEVSWRDDSGAWKKRLIWPILAVVALFLLVVQIAWLEFNRLNRIEPYRSVYAVACKYLGCVLPELIDRSQIQTSNLLVRTHPDTENALMVDVILQNNAEFEQPFPSLALTFSDLQNQPVATRKLTPKEYLGGELTGRQLMPSKQPIHIGLEIVDPGKEAVSYRIAIVD